MTVGDVTFRHADLIGATDAIALADDRVAIASPASGRVIQLRMERDTSRLRIEQTTNIMDPPPAYVRRKDDFLFVMGAWTPSQNGTLTCFLIDSPKVVLAEVEDPEMGGALFASDAFDAVLHGRTKETGMLVARDPSTLDEIDAIVVGKLPSYLLVDGNTIYVLNSDDAVVTVCTWTPSTSKLALTNKFTLPRGEHIQDITILNGLMFYVTGENFCIFDVTAEEMVYSYHDYLQRFRSITAITDVIDDTADYLFAIDKAKRQVDKSRQFRDPAFRRHLFGHFQQIIGTSEAPFFQVAQAKPRSVVRRLDSRNFVFDPETGTLTWAGAQCFRYRGWSGNSDAWNQADDDVTVTGQVPSVSPTTNLPTPGEQVSYDVAAENRLIWYGTATWALDPGGSFKDRAASFDGATALTTDTEVVAFTGDILTILAWIKPVSGTPAGTAMTVIAAATDLDVGWELRITGTTISFYKDSQLFLTSTVANLYNGAWHQVGVILTATTVRTVKDGVLSSTSPIPAPTPPAAPNAAFFLGLIADVGVYTDARDSAYITDLFAKGPRG